MCHSETPTVTSRNNGVDHFAVVHRTKSGRMLRNAGRRHKVFLMLEIGFYDSACQWWTNAIANQAYLMAFGERLTVDGAKHITLWNPWAWATLMRLQHAHANIHDRKRIAIDSDRNELLINGGDRWAWLAQASPG